MKILSLWNCLTQTICSISHQNCLLWLVLALQHLRLKVFTSLATGEAFRWRWTLDLLLEEHGSYYWTTCHIGPSDGIPDPSENHNLASLLALLCNPQSRTFSTADTGLGQHYRGPSDLLWTMMNWFLRCHRSLNSMGAILEQLWTGSSPTAPPAGAAQWNSSQLPTHPSAGVCELLQLGLGTHGQN